MGVISILVILTIFAFHSAVGQWSRIQTTDDENSFFASLIYLLKDGNGTNAAMRLELSQELGKNWNQYRNDERLQQAPTGRLMSLLVQEDVQFLSPVTDVLLELISMKYKVEIVICDWNKRNIDIYRKGNGITQRIFLLYSSENHFDPLYKNDNGTITRTFPLGNDTDAYNDARTVAQNPSYF